MNLNDFGVIVQSLSLPVLTLTVWATWKQAKAAQQTAKIAFGQFELARNQFHASFRPALDVRGNYGPNCVHFTLRNIGAGPAFGIEGQYMGGARIPLGNLEPGATTEFRFDNFLNMPQRMLEMGETAGVLRTVQDTPLRLEFDSVTGAHCWTKVAFKVGGGSDGTVETSTEQGMNKIADSGGNADGL